MRLNEGVKEKYRTKWGRPFAIFKYIQTHPWIQIHTHAAIEYRNVLKAKNTHQKHPLEQQPLRSIGT